MPLYMDIHRNLNATVDDVWKAHLGDIEAQEKYGVQYLKYWFVRPRTVVLTESSLP